jgi:hypothetical protein
MRAESIKQCALFIVLVLSMSIQAVLGLVWVLRFGPARSSAGDMLMPEYLNLAYPDRDVLFFRVFVLVLIIAGALVLRMAAQRENFFKNLQPFIAVEAVLTALLLEALFKSVVFAPRAQLAQDAFGWLLAAAVFNKVCWPFLTRTGREFARLWSHAPNRKALDQFSAVGCVALILVILYIPNPEASVARMFLGEQFHHFDLALMATGWAFQSGTLINLETLSQYGFGMPIVMSQLAKILGGFSYENVFRILSGLCIVYFLIWYFLFKAWFGSRVLALCAVLTAVRLQMFHTGAMPLVFTYPMATVWRFWFDVIFFILIFLHVRAPRRRLLFAAAVVCGAALYHMIDTGVYLTATFYAYLIMHAVLKDLRQHLCRSWTQAHIPAILVILPFVSALLFFWLTHGRFVLMSAFWLNMFEFIRHYLGGFSVSPIYETLKQRFFFSSAVGFLIPLVYLWTVLYVGTRIFLGKSRELFLVVIGVYGLVTYNYYVGHSAESSYYVFAMPFVAIVFYWLKTWLDGQLSVRPRVLGAVLALTLFALFTNHNYISYPNLLNVSRNPVVDPKVFQLPLGRVSYFNHLFLEYPAAFKLKTNSLGETDEQLYVEGNFVSDDHVIAYYRTEGDFKQDAGMIQELTPPGARVPLISSFEVKILMQAGRAPFFYYFPLVNSRPMRMRNFLVSSLPIKEHTERTIRQLEEAKPEYVFMESILLNRDIPAAYRYDSAGMIAILEYVYRHYEPVRTGKFLVAMRRKG